MISPKQFPEIPVPQSTLRAKQPSLLHPVVMYFHNYSNHWALFDSMTRCNRRQIHPELKTQMLSLYGMRPVKGHNYVERQKGSKDCGCIVITYSVLLLYGEDPSMIDKQKVLTEHIIDCFTNEHF